MHLSSNWLLLRLGPIKRGPGRAFNISVMASASQPIEDKELAELRAQSMGQMGASQQSAQQAQQAREQAEQRKAMLNQILTPEARARLSRVALVKPEKASGVENMLLQAAKSRQLGAPVTEEQLVQMLEGVTQQESRTKVTINRRASGFSDDEDDNDDDLL